MKHTYLIFLFLSLSAHASFKEKCLQTQQSKTNSDLNKQFEWIQYVFKSNDCHLLERRLKTITSIRLFFPTHETQKGQSTYNPIESAIHTSRYNFNYEKWLEVQKNFRDLSLFSEFKNIKHIDLDYFNQNDFTLKDIINQIPTINSISISSSELNFEVVNIIKEKNIDVHISGSFVLNNFVEELEDQIGGIQSFSGRILDLKRFKRLRTLGLLHIDPQSSLKELMLLKNLENLILSTKYISQMEHVSQLRNLKFLKIECKELRTENHSVSCISINPEKVEFIKYLSYLEGLSLAVKEVESIKPITSLKHLKYLSLSGSSLTETPELSDLETLKFLDLSFNDISSMNGVQNLKAKLIDLSFNQIEKVEDYPKLVNAEILLDGNAINKLSALDCPKDSLNKSIAKFCSEQ